VRRRAIGYARQSEDNADGIDRQKEDIVSLCQREDLDLVRIIEEDDTSASTKRPRPGYDGDLLPSIFDAGEADVIVAQTQDRLLRKITEMEHLIDQVEKTGNPPRVEVKLCRSFMDLSTAMGRASARQAAVWARLEVEQKAERQWRQQQQAALRGDPPGRRLFGYQPGGRELNEAEAAVVRDAYERLFRGETVTAVTEAVNAAGLPSAYGSYPWTRNGVRHLLRNGRYAGIRKYYDEVAVEEGNWPKIITREEHERALALLSDPARRTTTGNARKHLGTGLYLCGVCLAEGRRTTMRSTGRSGANASRGYVCSVFYHLSRAADPVDLAVTRRLEEYLSRPEFLDRWAHGDNDDVAPLLAERDRLEGKIAKAQRDYDDDLIDAADLKAVKARRNAELTVVRRKIAIASRQSETAQLANFYQQAADPAQAFRDAPLSLRVRTIDSLCEVIINRSTLPVGSNRFDPESVQIRWRVEAPPAP
jgi:site-specific DNA recombinase